jgi:hypothetical protein
VGLGLGEFLGVVKGMVEFENLGLDLVEFLVDLLVVFGSLVWDYVLRGIMSFEFSLCLGIFTRGRKFGVTVSDLLVIFADFLRIFSRAAS